MKRLILFSLWTLTVLTLKGVAFAESSRTQLLYEKTYAHANSYCRHNGKTLEFEIRSFDKYTELGDSEYGGSVFALDQGRPQLLPLNSNQLSRYRFFQGGSQHCSKSLSLPLNQDELAIFFLRDSRPLGDTLSVLIYNFKTSQAVLRETDFRVGGGFISEGQLKFQLTQYDLNSVLGKMLIDGKKFIYQEKALLPWMTFDGTSFNVDNFYTFERSPIKRHFSNQHEFERHFGWDAKTRRYKLQKYLIGIGQEERRECIAVPYRKKHDVSQHRWKCGASVF